MTCIAFKRASMFINLHPNHRNHNRKSLWTPEGSKSLLKNRKYESNEVSTTATPGTSKCEDDMEEEAFQPPYCTWRCINTTSQVLGPTSLMTVLREPGEAHPWAARSQPIVRGPTRLLAVVGWPLLVDETVSKMYFANLVVSP